MKLSQLGERRLIEAVRRRFLRDDPAVLIGIGDDAAVLRRSFARSARRDLLVATDALVEGVDFDLRYGSFHQVGFKALAANLSDIAAMGGAPRFFLVTLGLPGSLDLADLMDLYEGMTDLARVFGVRLIGGDLSAVRRRNLFISIAVLGEVGPGRAVPRSGARAGDWIFVTGTLGDSAAGLELAKALGRKTRRGGGLRDLDPWLSLFHRHFYPTPRLKEGRFFSERKIANSMIDLSDGLASDLRHLCEESGVGAELEAAALPLSPVLQAYARKAGGSPLRYALRGGEDFELLLTASPRQGGRLLKLVRKNKLRLSRIGRVLPRSRGIFMRDEAGRRRALPERGYEHFR